MYCTKCGSWIEDTEDTRKICPGCKTVHYVNPAPCVSVLVVSEGKVLLGLRGETNIKPEQWCLPCGYMEGTETIVEAAKREVMEETGIEIEPVSIVNVTTNHFPGITHSLVTVLKAEALTKELKPGDDIKDAAWYPIEGPFPPMAFQADLHIIGQYRKYGEEFGIKLTDTTIEFFE